MKSDGPGLGNFFKCRGKHVLAGVLLHVIEAPRPVDYTGDLRVRQLALNHVDYRFFFLRHPDHGKAAQGTPIHGLSA